MKLRKLKTFLFGVHKTIIFNLKYFKFKDAIKFPVVVASNVILADLKGEIEIKSPIKTGMIKIGFYETPFVYKQNIKSYWSLTGKIIFNGNANLGKGSKIRCLGNISFGSNFNISSNTNISCTKKIVFGDNTLIGYNCIFLDNDGHGIINEDGVFIKNEAEIISGNNVWYGEGCTVLKGSRIGNNTVIAANSLLTNKYNYNNCIVGGHPAKFIKNIKGWKM
ncbi:acyltransferase [Clostridium perfringens]|uniref:acyltransferase n=1 Tax=Clostridium perfringens TaxID=1502 RepID=UPI0018E44AD1|nr:acyltransferase [Clostridium perfringens]MBI6058982.1 acyltransferase [Clostridium perfringens]